MRIGLISDIHGNYEALKAVLVEMDKLNVSEIVCLGDVVGYYSQVNECCDELKSRGIHCLMGNHDWYLGSGGFCLRSRSANDCLAYQRKVITKENINWLRSFSLQRQIGDLRVVHGGWADPIDEYLQWTEGYFSQIAGDRFASGHTHIQIVRSNEGKTYCNPGSVGQPRDNDPRAAFAVYDGEFILHRVAYDPRPVVALMQQAGFDGYDYSNLKTGTGGLRRLHQAPADKNARAEEVIT